MRLIEIHSILLNRLSFLQNQKQGAVSRGDFDSLAGLDLEIVETQEAIDKIAGVL